MLPLTLLFVCRPDNDIYRVAQTSSAINVSTHRFDTLDAALQAATSGDGLLVMASGMRPATKVPQKNTTVVITVAQWGAIEAQKLRVYLEFPRTYPRTSTTPLTVRQTQWERAVVPRASTLLKQPYNLCALALLHPHKLVDFVDLPSSSGTVDLVLATVAGFDNATFGLPPPNRTFPLLVEASDVLLVAATQLSRCRTRRFAPSARWMTVVRRILAFVGAGNSASLEPIWVPVVRPTYSATEVLPLTAEHDALVRGMRWFVSSMNMPGVKQASQLATLRCERGAATSDGCAAFARGAGNYRQNVSGTGLLGIFEGFTSDIALDGSQPRAIEIRADCVCETSASFAALGAVTGDAASVRIASNLLSYAHIHSGFHQLWTVGAGSTERAARPWAPRGDAFGILAWDTGDAAFEKVRA